MRNKTRAGTSDHRREGVRLLLVDDHDLIRLGLRALLEKHAGWKICGEAATGREAIRLARSLRPDVVIMDLSMPDLSGLEATRCIRNAQPNVEVLVLTMHRAELLAQEAFDAGARAVLLKTDARRFLISAIEALAEHRPFFTPEVSQLIFRGEISLVPAARKKSVSGSLTARERDIVQMMADGKSSKEMAAKLGRSIRTIEVHRAHIMDKLGLDSAVELVRYALRNRLPEE